MNTSTTSNRGLLMVPKIHMATHRLREIRKPQVVGLLAFETGTVTNPLKKVNGLSKNPIGVPNNRSVDLWFAMQDDKTAAQNLQVNQLKLSYDLLNFTKAEVKNLEILPAIMGEGFDGNTVSFTHKTTVNFSTDTVGSFIYLRTFIKDDDHDEVTEIPNSGSNDLMKARFTLQVDSI